MSLVLYDWELCADCYRARLALALIGAPVRKVPVDVVPGRETDGPAFRALNPRGTLPVLLDGDVALAEPAAILVHLAETRDPSGRWLPTSGAARAACLETLAFATGDLRAADAARVEAMLGLPTPYRDAVASARAALRVLEGVAARRALAGEGFLAGPQATIADVAAFPAVALAVDFGCALEEFPKLRLWTRRVRALPGFVATPGVPEFL